MHTLTYTIDVPHLDDDPPGIPHGANQAEHQALWVCWRNAIRTARDVIADTVSIVEDLHDPDGPGPHRRPNVVAAAELAWRLGEYQTLRAAVVARLADVHARAAETAS